ncbi:MAG TPA: hypothetical protein VGU02_14330 [Gaiellaceae bacterium]|nr:hypothetical protein [Gaiellaceae bacterium]
MDEIAAARTEAIFREVNEAIAKTATSFDAEEADFVCECADPDCAHRVTASIESYEQVRSDGTHFLLVPGHEEPTVERVIGREASYWVVEKFSSVLSRNVRRLNPRRATG